MATRGIQQPTGLVTSEAVEIDLPAAALPLRALSGLIDLAVVLLVFALLARLGLSTVLEGDAALLQAVVIVVSVSALLAVPTTLETVLRGRTVGKLVTGLRTVRDDGGPIGLRHALTRALVGVVELWLTAGVVAVVVAASNERGKRLGDLAAGTYVVRERSRLRLPPPPAMPPGLAAWAAAADIGPVPDALAVAVRQFLLRADDLTPTARLATGRALYADTLAHVHPAPPAQAPVEAVLSAVLAERRRRDTDRLRRDDGLRARLLGPDPLDG